jgi:glycosyltransferase involved in cell wall biosynthesis/ubiquinone/menaquinone biosynthesis C-methylase UbiE
LESKKFVFSCKYLIGKLSEKYYCRKYKDCMGIDFENSLNNTTWPSKQTPVVRRLLVLDTSLTLEAIRERKLERSVTCRDLDGFFEHVWTVHPFATLLTSKKWTNTYGHPDAHSLAPAHTFIEGKIGRFSMLRWFSVLNFILSQIDIFLYLVRLIRKKKINVIRIGDPHYLGLFGWLLSKLCGIPFLVRVPGNYDKNYQQTRRSAMPRVFKTRRIEKIFEKFVLARADFVVAPNQDNLDFALANGARRENSTLFRYGNLIANQHFIEPKSRQEGQSLLSKIGVERGRFLLNIARLESLKHPDDLLHMLAEMRQRGHDFKLVLVGDGRLREDLMNLVDELGVDGHVIFCGNQNQEWLARVIPLAAVVVSPFMGRALTEAALGAAPIVAYDYDWQSELIQTGVTGELVPLRDWEKMTTAVERYLKDPTYARSMGSAVRNRVLEMMEPSKLDEHERKTYLGLLDRSQVQQINENIKVHNKTANDYASAHGEIFNIVEQGRLFLALKKSFQAVNTGSEEPTALDYGCGSGNLTQHLLNLNVDVVAADVSSHFLELVRQQFPSDRLSTLILNGKDIDSLETDSFDFIAVYSVLHHIPDYLAALTELARVCKPGGVIYLDHEPTDQFWSENPLYDEFQAKALRTDWGKYLIFSNYVGKVRRWFNPKYSNEGDIHVWPDDHIEWKYIESTLKRLGFEVVLSEDYLLYKKLYRPDIYRKYEKLCADTRLMAFRKCLI